MHLLIAGHPESTTNYQEALTALGASFDLDLHSSDLTKYDGLLLPGGGDIHPAFWGEKLEGSREIDVYMDNLQFRLLSLFCKKKMPVLGICKGMQIINVFFGGSIYQHLSNASSHEYIGHDQNHPTHTTVPSLLSRLYGGHPVTNSAHHQGIHTAGRSLEILQYSDDGVIEGIAHTSLPVIGVQWHPERMCFRHADPGLADGALLLSAFLKLCSQTTDIFD